MAELLVNMVSATHEARDNNQRAMRGMVVTIKEDGANWSARERQPVRDGGRFAILEMPGVRPSELEYLLDPEYDTFNTRYIRAKRKNIIDIDSLPSPIRTGLTNDGRRITNRTTLEPRVVVRETGAVRERL